MSAQGRVSSGRPDGGQYTSTEHSDAVVSLSPAADRLNSIAAIRSRRLLIREQQDFLANQKYQLDKQLRETAEASAALEILEVLPHATSITYRKDGSEMIFSEALDATGESIVQDDDFTNPDSPWSSSERRALLQAIRRSEEELEAVEWQFRGGIRIDVNAVIAKAGAKIESESAPDLIEAPLTPSQRKLLAKAAETVYSVLPEFMYGGRGESEEDLESLRSFHDELSTLLGYDPPRE